MGRKANKPEDVWEYIFTQEPDKCWPWMGFKSKRGYGVISINHRAYRAHRVVYALVNPGSIDFRLGETKRGCIMVCHSCDNPSCCNPAHLFLGTQFDNMADMVKKNRRHDFNGENGQRAKLTNEQASEVKRLAILKVPQKEISAKYGISPATISSIKHGNVYKGLN